MKIQVYIRNRVYTISCGVGAQKIRWLIQAASLRQDPNGMLMTGQPKIAKLQDGTQLNLNDRINERLGDNARIWVHFQQIAQQVQKKKDSKTVTKAK